MPGNTNRPVEKSFVSFLTIEIILGAAAATDGSSGSREPRLELRRLAAVSLACD